MAPATNDDICQRRVGRGWQAGWHHHGVERQAPVQLKDGNVIIEGALVKVSLMMDPVIINSYCLVLAFRSGT